MPPKKKPRPRGSAGKTGKGGGDRLHLRVAFALLFVFGFLVASLVGLSYLRESLHTTAPPPAHPPFEEKAPAGGGGEVLEDIRVELESALLRSGVSLADLESRKTIHGGTLLEITGNFPSGEVLEDLARRLRRLDPAIRLDPDPANGKLEILYRESVCYSLGFHPHFPPEKKDPAAPPGTPPSPIPSLPPGRPAETSGNPRMAIIMDDLGRDLVSGKALAAIDLPVTFAIMPGNGHAREVADLAHRHGREVIVHLPMEPQGFPKVNPGADALLVSMPPEEIAGRVREFLRRVPHAVGGNNHMGSRFTENPPGMQAVMEVLKGEGMFFVDSLTTGRSVGLQVARAAEVPSAVRDIFLDNEQEVHRIAAEIRRLVRVARRQGQAIGICHPYPETLEALRREAGAIKASGVEVVPVSRLVF